MSTSPNPSPEHSAIEREVIALSIALNNINSSVNNELLAFSHSKLGTEVIFATSIHQKYFYLQVLDFLSKNSDSSIMGKHISCLDLLRLISEKPALSGSVTPLTDSVGKLHEWLGKTVKRNIFIHDGSIEIEPTREEIIYISANISKHHFGHLTSVLNKLKKADKRFSENHQLIGGLEAIYYDLNDNVLNYHASVIAQLLNDIRLAMYEYLFPEYERAYKEYKRDGDIYYRYKYPNGVESELAMACYWELMNFVRAKPYMGKFTAHKYLSLRF